MTDHLVPDLVSDPDASRPRTENDDPLLGPAPAPARHGIEQPRQQDDNYDSVRGAAIFRPLAGWILLVRPTNALSANAPSQATLLQEPSMSTWPKARLHDKRHMPFKPFVYIRTNPPHYTARASRFRTVELCQGPPRAVRTPRAFRASATARVVVRPPACIWRTIGSTLAAKESAASLLAAWPIAAASARLVRLRTNGIAFSTRQPR
jgi:hypothetical protein